MLQHPEYLLPFHVLIFDWLFIPVGSTLIASIARYVRNQFSYDKFQAEQQLFVLRLNYLLLGQCFAKCMFW